MIRGEIRWVDFEPARPGEANKRRPAVIVSNDAANAVTARLGRGTVTVVPLTTNVDRVHSFEVLLPAESTGLCSDSKAQASQLRAVSAERIGDRVRVVPLQLMSQLDDAIRLHLDL